MTLFRRGEFNSHSGLKLDWKIDCDALTDEDLATLAWIVSKEYWFGDVIGIPRGGIRFADALKPYRENRAKARRIDYLIVDDVLTAGNSFREFAAPFLEAKQSVRGAVIFSRYNGPWWEIPFWVTPIFQLGYEWREE